MYTSLILMTIIVSLSTTVDRGVAIFKFLMALFGILLTLTMASIMSVITNDTFYPEVKYCS